MPMAVLTPIHRIFRPPFIHEHAMCRKTKATWFVVPGSGRGDLSGLRGEGGFEGDFGKGSDGTLDYWFE
jgi:hypothetical protein